MDGPILSHTRRIADQLAQEFRGNPEGELEIWATTAQQREAMVVELYDAAAIEERLPKRPGEPEVAAVVRKAIGGIWAQERSHTTLVESLRIVDEARLTALRSMLGAMEGLVTHTATAHSWTRSIASFLVGLGRTTGHAPEFTSGFRALTLREFFRFSQELETTAKEGYERIVELLDRVVPHELLTASDSNQTTSPIKLGITAPYEFAKTLAEECFHAAVFERLEGWLEPDGHGFKSLSSRDAVVQLRALAVEHLSFGSQHLGRSWTKSVNGKALVSDGGLGTLFKEYGVELAVTSA